MWGWGLLKCSSNFVASHRYGNKLINVGSPGAFGSLSTRKDCTNFTLLLQSMGSVIYWWQPTSQCNSELRFLHVSEGDWDVTSQNFSIDLSCWPFISHIYLCLIQSQLTKERGENLQVVWNIGKGTCYLWYTCGFVWEKSLQYFQVQWFPVDKPLSVIVFCCTIGK